MSPRTKGGLVFTTIALVVLLSEWIRSSFYGHHVESWTLVFGSVLLFIGGFWFDPKGAEDAAGFVVRSGIQIIGVVRGGRRATDPPVVVAEPTEPEQKP